MTRLGGIVLRVMRSARGTIDHRLTHGADMTIATPRPAPILGQMLPAPIVHSDLPVDAAGARTVERQIHAALGVGPVALSIFDQLSVGIVLVDRAARVLFANAAARAMAENRALLELNSNVATVYSEHARRLRDLVRSVLGGTSVRTTSLPSSGNGRPLMVLIAPIRDTELDQSHIRSLRAAAAMYLICDPDRTAQIPATWMRDAYGLTLAETRVALEVASGATIPDTARRLKVSANTVKTHLRRVYEKTGTSRQAELSRLIATISVARGNDS